MVLPLVIFCIIAIVIGVFVVSWVLKDAEERAGMEPGVYIFRVAIGFFVLFVFLLLALVAP